MEAAGGVAEQRLRAGGRVEAASCVVIERCITVIRVLVAGCVAVERSVTIGRVVIAADVARERISASGTIEKPAGVTKQRINASGGVEAAIGIASQGSNTHRRILVAGGQVIERLETKGCVPDPAGEAKEGLSALSGGSVGIASVWRWIKRLRHRRKRKAGEREHCQRGVNNIRYCFHFVYFLSLFFSIPKLQLVREVFDHQKHWTGG